MNISFDLDSTLIPHGGEFETERRRWLGRLFWTEQIRRGTRVLVADLRKQGHHVHIYTTSFRSTYRIRWTFWLHGIKVGRIINQQENQDVLGARNIRSSKYPPAFGFDVHVDDSPGVGLEGDRESFEVIVVDPGDRDWVDLILLKVKLVSESVACHGT